MCLLIAISGVVADAPLLIAANRDEFYDRDAVNLTVLQDTEPRMLGGRDLVAGGTWLAVNEHGVVAALTNKPTDGQRDPAKRSRGEIPLLLAAQPSASAAVDALESAFAPDAFNPCWVLVGDRRALVADSRVVALYGEVVREANAGLANFETIKRFRLVADEWSPGTGELTPSMKLKRRVISAKYAAVIDELYADEATARAE